MGSAVRHLCLSSVSSWSVFCLSANIQQGPVKFSKSFQIYLSPPPMTVLVFAPSLITIYSKSSLSMPNQCSVASSGTASLKSAVTSVERSVLGSGLMRFLGCWIMVVLGHRLGSVTSEIFSSKTDSLILWFCMCPICESAQGQDWNNIFFYLWVFEEQMSYKIIES